MEENPKLDDDDDDDEIYDKTLKNSSKKNVNKYPGVDDDDNDHDYVEDDSSQTSTLDGFQQNFIDRTSFITNENQKSPIRKSNLAPEMSSVAHVQLSPMHDLKVFLAQEPTALFNINTYLEINTSDDEQSVTSIQSSIIECGQRTRLRDHQSQMDVEMDTVDYGAQSGSVESIQSSIIDCAQRSPINQIEIDMEDVSDDDESSLNSTSHSLMIDSSF